MDKQINKPVIETMINSAALALTSIGVVWLTNSQYMGFCLIGFAVGLEFFKYWGLYLKQKGIP